ncbi:MAG: hypothetical protein HYY26_03000 [Acidobacteria bacterium]|nr:hypothetical protein [Acidobacteriota bacterium]
MKKLVLFAVFILLNAPASVAQLRNVRWILERARDAAGTAPSEEDTEARTVLVRLVCSLAQVQLKAGDWEAAIATARSSPDPFCQAKVLSQLALARKKNDDPSGAVAALQEALQVAQHQRPISSRGLFLGENNDPQFWPRAVREEAFQQRVEEFNRDSALQDIAGVQMELGDTNAALQTTMMIRDRGSQIHFLCSLAIHQAKTTGRASAESTIRKALEIHEEEAEQDERFSNLLTIATAQARIGDTEAARENFDKARNMAMADNPDWLGGWRLAEVASYQAQAKDREGALETLRDALRIADETPAPNDRAFLLWNIVERMAELGDQAGALAIVEKIPSSRGWSDPQALRAIVESQLKAGDVSGALQTAARIEDTGFLSNALHWIARSQVAAGDRAAALATLQASLDAALRSAEVGVRDYAIAYTAMAFAELGEYAIALKVLSSVEDLTERVDFAREIAYVQAKAGHADETLVWALAEPSSLARAYALLGLAEGLLEVAGTPRD